MYNEPFFVHDEKQQTQADEKDEEEELEDNDEPVLKKRKSTRPIMLMPNKEIENNTFSIKKFVQSVVRATVGQKYNDKIDLNKLSSVIHDGLHEIDNGELFDEVASQVIARIAGQVLQHYLTDIVGYFKRGFKTIAQHLNLTSDQLDTEYPNIELYDWRPQRISSNIYDLIYNKVV